MNNPRIRMQSYFILIFILLSIILLADISCYEYYDSDHIPRSLHIPEYFQSKDLDYFQPQEKFSTGYGKDIGGNRYAEQLSHLLDFEDDDDKIEANAGSDTTNSSTHKVIADAGSNTQTTVTDHSTIMDLADQTNDTIAEVPAKDQLSFMSGLDQDDNSYPPDLYRPHNRHPHYYPRHYRQLMDNGLKTSNRVLGRNVRHEELSQHLKELMNKDRIESKFQEIPESHELIGYEDERQLMVFEREREMQRREYQRLMEYERHKRWHRRRGRYGFNRFRDYNHRYDEEIEHWKNDPGYRRILDEFEY